MAVWVVQTLWNFENLEVIQRKKSLLPYGQSTESQSNPNHLNFLKVSAKIPSLLHKEASVENASIIDLHEKTITALLWATSGAVGLQILEANFSNEFDGK
jgi:hypothetical protein